MTVEPKNFSCSQLASLDEEETPRQTWTLGTRKHFQEGTRKKVYCRGKWNIISYLLTILDLYRILLYRNGKFLRLNIAKDPYNTISSKHESCWLPNHIKILPNKPTLQQWVRLIPKKYSVLNFSESWRPLSLEIH